jgi:hypothetical protein
VDAEQGRAVIGQKGKRDCAGILIPYYRPGELSPINYRVRRDHPDWTEGKDGKLKPERKYLSAPGSLNKLYFPPEITPEQIADSSMPIVILEGEKKALAMSRLATYGIGTADKPRFIAVAVPGVWNWRGVVGKANGPDGQRIELTGAIPDLSRINWGGRKTFILFDADANIKESVARARRALSYELAKRGADVSLIHLPADCGYKGVDDLLAAEGGPERVVQLLEKPTPALRGAVAPLPQFDSRPEGMFHAKTTTAGEVLEVKLTNWRAAVETIVTLDDGVETIREFEINAELMGRTFRFLVSAANFAAMNWPIEQMGPAAIIFPNRREHARTAVQSFSLLASEQRVYTHTGWRLVDGQWIYLNAGAAIGPSGPLPDINVRLSGSLTRYELQLPSGPDQLTRAVRASLRLLELGPPAIAFALGAARCRSIFGAADFAIHLSGATGNFKSERSALEQQHFGVGLNSRNLPGSWASTANALETLAFLAKDAVLVIDDFAPQGGVVDIARMHAAADRVFRAAGNHSGRGRLDSTAKLRDVKPPRSLIISTGEEVPNGQSIRARLLILELAKGEIDAAVLSECQQDAAAGLYAQAMGGFVQWVAAKYEDLRAALSKKSLELRGVAVQAGANAHARTAEIAANLHAGFEFYLQFAEECGAVDAGERERLAERCWTALIQAAAAQSSVQAASDPATRFIRLVAACLSSGRAHLAGVDGAAPACAPEACGWRVSVDAEVEHKKVPVPSEQHKKAAVPFGDCIGWVDSDFIYLDPLPSHRQAQLMAGSEPLPITVRTLEKRLLEKGLLASHGTDRGVPIRKTLAGSRKAVLHFRRETILPKAADQVWDQERGKEE